MKIIINDHRKLFAVREDFSGMFPQLDLLFFARPDHQKAGASHKTILHGNKTLGECRIIHNKGTLTITPHMTIAELEDNFSSIYGLNVKVMIKSNGKPMPVHSRRDSTLEELNRKSEWLAGAASGF